MIKTIKAVFAGVRSLLGFPSYESEKARGKCAGDIFVATTPSKARILEEMATARMMKFQASLSPTITSGFEDGFIESCEQAITEMERAFDDRNK